MPTGKGYSLYTITSPSPAWDLHKIMLKWIPSLRGRNVYYLQMEPSARIVHTLLLKNVKVPVGLNNCMRATNIDRQAERRTIQIHLAAGAFLTQRKQRNYNKPSTNLFVVQFC